MEFGEQQLVILHGLQTELLGCVATELSVGLPWEPLRWPPGVLSSISPDP